MKCDVCEKELRLERGDFDYTGLAGLDEETHQIILEGIEVLRCECGDSPNLPNVDGLHYTIGLSLIRDERPLDGSAVRFLRKTVGMTQREFARSIEITPEYLSEWETGKQLPKKPTRIAAAVKFLEHLLHSENRAKSIDFDVIADTISRMAARASKDVHQRRAEIQFDAAAVPPAWMISELQCSAHGRIGGGA